MPRTPKGPRFQHRHYEVLALSLHVARARCVWNDVSSAAFDIVVNQLANTMWRDNPKFDKARFDKAVYGDRSGDLPDAATAEGRALPPR